MTEATPPIVPLTADQERYLNERISAALKRYVRSATVAFLVLAVGIIVGFTVNEQHNQDSREAVVRSGQAVAIVGCNRDYGQAERAREQIREDYTEGIKQLKLFVAEGTLTEAQGDRANKTSKKRTVAKLKDTPLPDCRGPLSILTADPDDPIKIPVPLFPGSAKD